jgi:hypothetical protein
VRICTLIKNDYLKTDDLCVFLFHCAPGRLSWPPKLRNKLFLPLLRGWGRQKYSFHSPRVNTAALAACSPKKFCTLLNEGILHMEVSAWQTVCWNLWSN